MCILWQKSLTLSRTETANLIWKLQHLRCEAAEAKTPLWSMHDRSDLEQVPVHYVLATEGAHRHCRRDGGGGGGEGGRRVFVLFKNIIRTGWTLTKKAEKPNLWDKLPTYFLLLKLYSPAHTRPTLCYLNFLLLYLQTFLTLPRDSQRMTTETLTVSKKKSPCCCSWEKTASSGSPSASDMAAGEPASAPPLANVLTHSCDARPQ